MRIFITNIGSNLDKASIMHERKEQINTLQVNYSEISKTKR